MNDDDAEPKLAAPDAEDDPAGHDGARSEAFPTVAIGSSAGGLRALQELFNALPPDLGAAFVVVSHLDPSHPSELVSILRRRTPMPVNEVGESMPLEPNRVYVIAPDRQLRIDGREIATAPFDEPRGLRAPIDMFFRSLAAQHGDGLAVILSGSGSDGSLGIRAVKEAGGVVLVQDPDEAEYGSMPRSAIATGCADLVLPVADLARKLAEFIDRKQRLNLEQNREGAQDVVRRILSYLRARTQHDFSNYKRPTIVRRLMRRMQINRRDSLEDYFAYLRDNVEEARALFDDLLISVTTFFRDNSAFVALAEHVIPELFERQDGGESIRVWVAGCATGEEAYSIAILLLEEAARRETLPDIQIFATDLDASALTTAREGRYPAVIEADVSEQRLKRFFSREGDNYRIKKEARGLIVFAAHSVLKDPPFSRLDLVSCRNLLIYLQRDVQNQLLATLHYALKPGGYLFLGSVETVDARPSLFRIVDRKARIFQAVEGKSERLALSPRPPLIPAFAAPRVGRAASPPAASGAAVRHGRALGEMAPPTVLVDADYRLLNLSETAGRYLMMRAGPPSQDLTQIVRPELRLDVGAALRRAFEKGEPTLSGPIPVRFNGAPHDVILNVRPVTRGRASGEALVMFIEGASTLGAPGGIDSAAPTDAMISDLREDLTLAQDQLRSSRQDHEATNEELRAANEELQSINEEYRSTSEELETSKEELQSMNEELQTLNAELKAKLDDATHANSDLQNLIAATEGGTLFLDSQLRIRRFTPRITDLFNIAPGDEGRLITDFTHKLKYDSLVEDVRTVLRDLAPIEREIENSGNDWRLMRIRPYRTVDDRIEGAVLTFVDVTPVHRAQGALRDSDQRFQTLVLATSDVLFQMSPDWAEMRQLDGRGFLRDSPSTFTAWLSQYVPTEDQPLVTRAVNEAIRTKSVFQIEHRVRHSNGTVSWTSSRAVPLSNERGEILGWFAAASDVTARKEAETRVAESEARYRAIVDSAASSIIVIDDAGIIQSANPAANMMFGFEPSELVGANVTILMSPEQARDHDEHFAARKRIGVSKAIGASLEVVGRRKDGSHFEAELTVAEWRDQHGRRLFGGLITSLAERKRVEAALVGARRMEAVGRLSAAIAHDFNNLLTVIIGNLELIGERVSDEGLRPLLRPALQAAEAGAAFNRRLLSLSGRRRLSITPFAVNDRIRGFAKLIEAALGSTIALKLDLADNLWLCVADPCEFDNALLNLAMNSRDALPHGGEVAITTRNAAIEAAEGREDAHPVDYVRLSVIDNGEGMTPEVLRRAQEPFFSTKAEGKGVGLGLSGVRTFVERAGGFLAIESREGMGTTVSLHLPRAPAEARPPHEAGAEDEARLGDGEIVLVVEDDEAVREVMLKRVEALGYVVESARCGEEAIEILKSGPRVDVILSDVLMPDVSGHDIRRWVRANKPAVKIVLMTGFSPETARADRDGLDAPILFKPFTREQLSTALADALGKTGRTTDPAPGPT